VQSVAERDAESIVSAGVEWVVLSSDAWGGRAPRPGAGVAAAVPEAYAPIIARARTTKVIVPSAVNPGPVIHILHIAGR
jgi:hypothetical protein